MKLYLFLLFCIILHFKLYSQEIEKSNRALLLGLNYGQSYQDTFPFNNHDYMYNNQFFKIQIKYLFARSEKFQYELNIEPSFYYSKFQLFNQNFIKPLTPPYTSEPSKGFSAKRSFEEYAVNFGIIMRYPFLNKFSTYFLGSIGPMFSTEDTERLKKGFAFSDIVGVGISYKEKFTLFDLRLTLRHTSNANLTMPNYGHNSVGIESGISFQIN